MGLFISMAYGKGPEEPPGDKKEPPKVGNFILPPYQQPGPLVGFGQNILDQNLLQLAISADSFFGANQHRIEAVPSVLYGLTEDFSLFLNLPIAVSIQGPQNQSSSGLEDAFLQLEYAFYANSTYRYTEQATIVANVTYPTGSSTKNPPTGLGSESFFLGATYDRMYVNWFLFTSYGAVLTTSKDQTQFGNSYLYQGGLGRNLFDIGTSWIFAWMVEADGLYEERNTINGAVDPNSGGNVVYITPSLWVSSKHLIAQFGVGWPVIQNLFGNQTNNNYLFDLNLSWTF